MCLRYPFDWHTPVGFLVCAVSQASTVFARGQIIICSLSLVAGFSLFMSEFVSDLEQVLRNIDQELSTPKEGYSSKHEIRSKFYGFIQFDSEAKQLSQNISNIFFLVIRTLRKWFFFFRFINRFSHVNAGIIFLYLVYVVVSISSLLLQIHIVIGVALKRMFKHVIVFFFFTTLVAHTKELFWHSSSFSTNNSQYVMPLRILSFW